MPKVVVFQHVAREILGTLDPLLRQHSFRIRYVNFEREPDAKPSLDKYDGLIVLGGHMGVYEAEKYTHIKVEMELIEKALKKDIPVLGICLGAQMLAKVLGSHVRKHTQQEIGWCDVHLTDEGHKDKLFSHFKKTERIFQLHGDTFDIPTGAEHLAWSEVCPGQAFRYGKKVYGLQFHLEVDEPMIERWLKIPESRHVLKSLGGDLTEDIIRYDTERYLAHSIDLSQMTFMEFLKIIGIKQKSVLLGSGDKKSI